MKNLNETQHQLIEKSTTNEIHLNHLDMRVYNEMNDVTSSEVNVLEQIQKQFSQINDLNHRRQFILKEVSQYIVR